MKMLSSNREQITRLFVLTLFALGIIICVAGGFPLLWALGFGAICFSLHARSTGMAWLEIVHLLLAGIRRVSSLLTIFLLIGMLTGIWRISGTIPFLLDKALTLIDPTFFVLWVFLLCAGLSTLIGTSFGTVSTLGVICMLMARTAGFDETLVGGAILSGVYVGDRCSPMSSSAALVSAITRTNIYDNIRNMLRTSLVPMLLTCTAYAVLSLTLPEHDATSPITLLSKHFQYGIWVLLPALTVLLLGILRINVKIAMAISILLAMSAGLLVQHASPAAIASCMLFGYVSPIPELELLNGGGGRYPWRASLALSCSHPLIRCLWNVQDSWTISGS